MTTNYVLSLADKRVTIETTGGKGASLARLSAAGLPVPDGFHTTTEAYRRFVAENDLQPGILAALEPIDPAQPATLEAASARIHALFTASPIPTDLAEAIKTAYTDLTNHHSAFTTQHSAVAVRSSATAEDLPDYSGEIPPRKAAWQVQRQLNPPAMLPETSRWAKLGTGARDLQGDVQMELKGFGRVPHWLFGG